MKLKRAILCVFFVLLLAALPMMVGAERPESMDVLSKEYVLSVVGTRGSIKVTPNTSAFWEYPLLRAGEDYVEGTMTIRNSSAYTVSMALDEITLPYGDRAKLTYLDHLQLTVKEGDTVLYDNTYAHVNDEVGGLEIAYNEMAPGEEHVYTIKLRCRYDYAGNPNLDVSQVSWLFGASTQTTSYSIREPEGLPEWAKLTVVIFAVMLAVLIVIAIVRAIVKAVKKAKQPLDKSA